jgi:uncharacterized protein (DUF305 family)
MSTAGSALSLAVLANKRAAQLLKPFTKEDTMKTKLIALMTLGAALAAPAIAQPPSSGAAKHPENHAAMAGADHEQMAAMEKMHKAMMAAKDPDADRDFALKMIEHHRGGIAMSEIVIKHGDDAEAKRMAQKTIDAQKKEIAELESWLDRHGGRKAKS